MTDTLESSACFVVFFVRVLFCCGCHGKAILANSGRILLFAAQSCKAHLRSVEEVSEGLLMRLLGSSLDAATRLRMI